MTPLHMMMAISQTVATATLKAQSAWWDASLATADKMTRVHETPAHAADRAAQNLADGSSRGWYRAPAAEWSEISGKAAGAHPVNAMMEASGWPAAFGAPFAGMPAFQNPFMGMMMAGPFSLPGMFGVMPGLSMELADGTKLKADFAPRGSDTAPDGSDIAVRDNGDAAVQSGEAIASITMPDNTVYKITIPMAGPLPFWPWASGFGAGVHAAQPTVIEGSSTDESET
jgi:hypothetical protein